MNTFARLLARFMWMPISTAPQQTKLLIAYRPYKHPWVTTAAYYAEKTLEAYDDYHGDDDGFVPAGWYEEGCEAETYWRLSKNPTHWRWMPRAPRRRMFAVTGNARVPSHSDTGDKA